METSIIKKVLPNGLTVLIYPLDTIPKVCIQLWYGVGSKHELDGERGLAHLLEHMTFKGTKKLSESDINLITHRLSGYCNAFTSHDYTAYVFDMPRQNWDTALELLADCMVHCTFKNDLLHSEVKAVVQELKMYRDDYATAVMEELLGAIFSNNAYHYPIIGYKQDLGTITRDSLLRFYKKHYLPNSATLVIVGDVDPDQVLDKVEHGFESIAADRSYKKTEQIISHDIKSKSVTIYRDVQQAQYTFAFAVPGLRQQFDYIIDLANWIFAEGRGSRLYKKLVEEKRVATDVAISFYDMIDASVLFVTVVPSKKKSQEQIRDLIVQELLNLSTTPVTDQELDRGIAQVAMDYLATFDSMSKIAYAIGRSFTATGDEHAFFKYPHSVDQSGLKHVLQTFFKRYFQPTVMHEAALLPLPSAEKKRWLELQTQADQQDAQWFGKRQRESLVEKGDHVHNVALNELGSFKFPRAQRVVLPNGLTLVWHDREFGKKIEMIVELKAKYYYDDPRYQGIATFVSEMLLEGTARWTSDQLTDQLEAKGINLSVQPGFITMGLLADDLPFAFEVLYDLLTAATFPAESVEKIREQLFADLEVFWDSPFDFVGQLAKEVVYDGHPYGKNPIGTRESLAAITRDDLINYYRKYYTPKGANLVLVGALQPYALEQFVKKHLGGWQGSEIAVPDFPALKPIKSHTINYPIARDQIVLCFTGLSVDRYSPLFDSLLLFDQIFTGGVLGSMNSRLFQLREQTGLFYTIGGSAVSNVDEQPGMVFIRTIVSPEQAKEAQELIKKTIETVADTLTPEDLLYARNAVLTGLIDSFESNGSMAEMFLFLEHFKLPSDYLDTRIEQLKKVTLDDLRVAVRQILDPAHLAVLRVGRSNE